MTTQEAHLIDSGANRIPRDFLPYFEKVETPRVRRARRLARLILRFDPIPDDERVLDYAHSYYDADPVAEAFVDDVYMTRGAKEGRRMLDQAIEHGVDSIPDAPESMRTLFDEFERAPEWLDPDVVAKGQAIFRRFGPSIFSFQGVETLLGYTDSSIVKPLSFTGSYAGDTAINRFMETSRFWIDISDPGGLEPGGAGRASAMRVRVMHVFLRRRLSRHELWDEDAWGVPLSQAVSQITLMASSFTPGVMMHLLGYRTRKSEIEAMLHLWRYVGYLLGVQPRWYPADLKEAAQLSAVAWLSLSDTAGQDGVELVESYPRAFAPKPGRSGRKRARDEINYRFQLGYTRYFLPGSFYGRYEMPNPWPWALLPLLQVPINLVTDTLRPYVPALARAQDAFARRRREQWWRNERGERKAEFAPVQEFRR